MFKLSLIKPFLIHVVSGSFYSKRKKEIDKYKVIMLGNIMVAQGYECNKCKLIRPYNVASCNCH